MPVYKGKRKGTWRIVVWARPAAETRSKAHEWIVTGTKSEAETFEAKKRLELGRQQRSELRTAPLFSSFCVDHYTPHAKQHLKAGTWERRQYQVATLIQFLRGVKIDALTFADVERFKELRTREGLKAISINAELSLLRAIIDYADSLGLAIPKLSWKRLPEVGRGRVLAWTHDEIGALFSAAREVAPEIVSLLVFLLNTGCRKGEAIACEWPWIDFERNMIRIPVTAAWSPKSGKPREIPMADAVRATLTGPRLHERWVFPTAWGRRYKEFPYEFFWRARDKAGLTGGPHTTRHTFASHFLANYEGSNALQVLADILGHSTTKVTEIYAHLLPGHLSEARNAVNLSPTISSVSRKGKKSTA